MTDAGFPGRGDEGRAATGSDAVSREGSRESATVGPVAQDAWPTPITLEDARAKLARVDDLPVSERVELLAAVNELIVAELTALDEV
ncbi:MAG: hypothetical protein ABR592_09425 [Nitriliruptorales bacterium]